ncbi:hypothetical protein Aph01nite_77190 [Acrocarpospora phusangensis]|uniref:Uncharacterized protein n=1 Tax=Acrocarpospora phusangensis TaxID=1070424 RepID=A0A919QJS3_9ACTN|nr:hypothetical protein [Acrocarpospora phusangensis]GIH29409.1 hypothetical protein Aph01nite_77190 [Acrocarpospora phusangensis]
MAETANPMHTALLDLRRRLRAELHVVEQALAKADQDMGGGLVWLGPEARRWRDDLGQRRTQIRRAADRLSIAIEDALAGQPSTVAESMADMYRRQMSGRL